MTLKEFMTQQPDDETLYYVGARDGASFIFIGTKDEYFKYIDKTIQMTIDKLKSSLEFAEYSLRQDEGRIKECRDRLKNFVPYDIREVVEWYGRDPVSDKDLMDGTRKGMNVIIEGSGQGKIWFHQEFLDEMERAR